MTRKSAHAWRHRCYELLEQGAVGDWASRLVDGLIIGLIVTSLIAVALESVPALVSRMVRRGRSHRTGGLHH